MLHVEQRARVDLQALGTSRGHVVVFRAYRLTLLRLYSTIWRAQGTSKPTWPKKESLIETAHIEDLIYPEAL